MSSEPVQAAILIVEDNPQVCHFLAAVLAELSYETKAATTVREALEVLSAPEPVVVLVCDFTLPDGNGLDLARKAVKLRPGLPVLLMSGYDTGGLGFPSIQKPFEPEQLLGKVRELLGT